MEQVSFNTSQSLSGSALFASCSTYEPLFKAAVAGVINSGISSSSTGKFTSANILVMSVKSTGRRRRELADELEGRELASTGVTVTYTLETRT